jgi:CheY-like chemotaxis protein
MLAAVLDQCGAEVKSANSAAAALETLQVWKPDVLVSDIGMPGEDGYTLISKVRALEPEHGTQILAVALTAHARTEDRMRALSSGFQMHVPKPVEPAELIMVIASLTRHQGARTP